MYSRYTDEERKFIAEYYPTHSRKDTLKAYNEHFETKITESQLKHRIQKFRIKGQTDGRFTRIGDTWNKGMNMYKDRPDLVERMLKTRHWQKGNVPKNKLPVGSRTDAKESVLIKIAEPNVWVNEGRYIYEQNTGEKLTPKDVILHLDGDYHNNEFSNLMKVDRGIILRLNGAGYSTKDRELTITGVALVKLVRTIQKKEKKSE